MLAVLCCVCRRVMASLSWSQLHQRVRFARMTYIDELRAENDLTARIGVLSLMHHRLVRNAKYLSGWVQFLRTGRSTAMDRNEWSSSESQPTELHALAQSQSEPVLERLDAFIRMLRSRPDVLAVMGLASLDPITNKLKVSTQHNTQCSCAVLHHTLC